MTLDSKQQLCHNVCAVATQYYRSSLWPSWLKLDAQSGALIQCYTLRKTVVIYEEIVYIQKHNWKLHQWNKVWIFIVKLANKSPINSIDPCSSSLTCLIKFSKIKIKLPSSFPTNKIMIENSRQYILPGNNNSYRHQQRLSSIAIMNNS